MNKVNRVLNGMMIFQLMAIWLLSMMILNIPEAKMHEATEEAYYKGYSSGYISGYSHGTDGLPMDEDRHTIKVNHKVWIGLFVLPFAMWIIMSIVCAFLDKTHSFWWHLRKGWWEALK